MNNNAVREHLYDLNLKAIPHITFRYNSLLLTCVDELETASNTHKLDIFITDLLYRLLTQNNFDIAVIGRKGTGKSSVACAIKEIINHILKVRPDIKKEIVDNIQDYEPLLRITKRFHVLILDEIDREHYGQNIVFYESAGNTKKRNRQQGICTIECTTDLADTLYEGVYDYILLTQEIVWGSYITVLVYTVQPDPETLFNKKIPLCFIDIPFPSTRFNNSYLKRKAAFIAHNKKGEQVVSDKFKVKKNQIACKMLKDKLFIARETKEAQVNYILDHNATALKSKVNAREVWFLVQELLRTQKVIVPTKINNKQVPQQQLHSAYTSTNNKPKPRQEKRCLITLNQVHEIEKKYKNNETMLDICDMLKKKFKTKLKKE